MNDVKLHPEVEQVEITEKVHPNELVGSLLKDFFNKGGSSSFAHIFSKLDDVKSTFSKWIMEVNDVKNNVLPLTHGGKPIATLKTNGLQNCLIRNNLGVKMSSPDDSKKVLTFSNEDNDLTFTNEEFEPFSSFLSDLCYLVEYSKLHYNDWRSSILIHHLESFLQVSQSEHKELFMRVLSNSMEL